MNIIIGGNINVVLVKANDDATIYEITSMTWEEGSKCGVSFTKVILTTNIPSPDTSTSFYLSHKQKNRIQLYCNNITELTIECSITDILASGRYFLSRMDVDSSSTAVYDLSKLTDSLYILPKKTLSDTQEKEQTVDRTNKQFKVELAEESIDTPLIYAGSDNDSEINCERSSTTLTCTPDKTNMPSSGEYEIYYKNLCGELLPTGIIVKYISSIQILKLELSNNEQCSSEEINEFTITTDIPPSSQITNVKLKNKNEDTFTFSCSFNDVTITCSNPSPSIEEGEYYLDAITSEETYNKTLIENILLKYQIDPISGVDQKKEQTVKTFSPNFTIQLKEGITTAPNIYIGGDEDKEQINCSINNTILTCETQLKEEKQYEIYYEGACEKIKSTGITITYVINKEIKVEKILLSNEDTCSESPLNEFKIYFDTEPTKEEITALMSVNGKDVTFKCSDDILIVKRQLALINQMRLKKELIHCLKLKEMIIFY